MGREEKRTSRSAAFKAGVVSLAFLLIGYETALFVHRAKVLAIADRRDHPDTVYVIDEALAARLLEGKKVTGEENAVGRKNTAGSASGNRHSQPAAEIGHGAEEERETDGADGRIIIRKNSTHSDAVAEVRKYTRKVENFKFNPNTVSVEDLQRLGFSEKQAAAIDNYRNKGGRFRRNSDFAKSFVVSDSTYKRLEPFIDIPGTDINKADSSAFDDLPGIGGYFASKLVEYRNRLGGFSYKEQMMDIRNFDSLKFEGLKDLVYCSRPEPYPLWELPADELRKHPYINSWQCAKSIVFFREHSPESEWKVENLEKYNILPPENAKKLSRCLIK